MDKNKKNNTRGKSSNYKWFITIFITTFVLSLFFSYISTVAMTDISIIPAILLLLLIIFVGILFDIIGVAVTVADEKNFHAMAAKREKGAKTSIKLIKASAKVANICADVIGDICGVLSGAVGATLALKITSTLNLSVNLQFLISALIASLTVGGKALGKVLAQNNSTQIISFVGRMLSFGSKDK